MFLRPNKRPLTALIKPPAKLRCLSLLALLSCLTNLAKGDSSSISPSGTSLSVLLSLVPALGVSSPRKKRSIRIWSIFSLKALLPFFNFCNDNSAASKACLASSYMPVFIRSSARLMPKSTSKLVLVSKSAPWPIRCAAFSSNSIAKRLLPSLA